MRPSSRLRKGSGDSTARSTLRRPAGWRYGWIRAAKYLSYQSPNQLRYWGIDSSLGFLEDPETNGGVERWNRTLKKKAVYGRVFRNLA